VPYYHRPELILLRRVGFLASSAVAFTFSVASASAQGRPPQVPPGPMLDEGIVTLQDLS
jgi:hypothetical protein